MRAFFAGLGKLANRIIASRDWEATFIVFAAMLVGTTRWTSANMAGEGFDILPEWMAFWIPTSAVLSAAMAAVEAWAFSYVLRRLSEERGGKAGKRAKRTMTVLLVASMASFLVVLTPSIMRFVEGVSLWQVLGNRTGSGVWALALALSTMSVVAAVGYASGRGARRAKDG